MLNHTKSQHFDHDDLVLVQCIITAVAWWHLLTAEVLPAPDVQVSTLGHLKQPRSPACLMNDQALSSSFLLSRSIAMAPDQPDCRRDNNYGVKYLFRVSNVLELARTSFQQSQF